MNSPVIEFESIDKFKTYCETGNIKPELNIIPKKHQNRKAEFLHQIDGSFDISGHAFAFTITELFPSKEKINEISLNLL